MGEGSWVRGRGWGNMAGDMARDMAVGCGWGDTGGVRGESMSMSEVSEEL